MGWSPVERLDIDRAFESMESLQELLVDTPLSILASMIEASRYEGRPPKKPDL